jgi:hypothetical protein
MWPPDSPLILVRSTARCSAVGIDNPLSMRER